MDNDKKTAPVLQRGERVLTRAGRASLEDSDIARLNAGGPLPEGVVIIVPAYRHGTFDRFTRLSLKLRIEE